ncbi:superoxide dismutase family protein [Streptomyces sp. NPDC051207]|uniref:superoxide dismutase family protein n=1 Tax=Streptomyces sp. NPDC051207 TaxID=3154641 RepID=UPI00344A3BA9
MAGLCAGALAAAVLVTGTAGATGADGYATGANAHAPGAHGHSMRTAAFFAPPAAFLAGGPPTAVTYDTRLVPVASWIEVRRRTRPGGAMTVTLRVAGLRPGHAYGVHVHRRPCGADPATAGGHYQHEPSGDPAAVNPRNEVWLDFTADGLGRGAASARHERGFRRGEASSVVLHTAPGGGGTRVACFTVPFDRPA